MEINTTSFGVRATGAAVCAENGAVGASTMAEHSSATNGFIGRDRSYNLAVPSRVLSAVIALALVAPASRPAAQEPSLADVLSRAAVYVQRFHNQLSEIVSEETYSQIAYASGRRSPSAGNISRVRLKSDLMLIKPVNVDRYVEFRDVFEVDGEVVRDRKERIAALWLTGSTDSTARLGAILEESARYNIGGIQRNINTPLMALMFLDAAYQPRFNFKRSAKGRPVLDPEHTVDASGVFRVGTEMWNVEFEERRGNTIIRQPNGNNLRSRGRFWINPDTGAVMISELVIDGGGVVATVTVSYQSEPLMGFLVPVEMHESYERHDELITGHAVYGRFRLIKQ